MTDREIGKWWMLFNGIAFQFCKMKKLWGMYNNVNILNITQIKNSSGGKSHVTVFYHKWKKFLNTQNNVMTSSKGSIKPRVRE